MNSNNYVLIMAGGVGSRFWPKSRNNFPKQFLDILGIGKSLLQLTYERFLKLCPKENIFIVTNSQYEDIILRQLEGVSSSQLICEPSRNNTAPCIAYASFKLNALNSDANIVVAPSDHFILHEDIFLAKIKMALEYTEKNEALVTLGISPTRPDTGYGYIKYDFNQHDVIYKVAQFTEKPSLEKAKNFLAEGNYVWNAGIFIWKIGSILNALKRYSKDIFILFDKGNSIYNTEAERDFIDENYPSSPNISIDYAIMEQADNVYTIPADFGWSDLGTWASLHAIAGKDENGNVVNCQNFHLKETSDCVIDLPAGKAIVVKGLSDYIIVDDGNVLLIYPKSEEQEIKGVAQRFSKDFGNEYI